MYIDSCQGSQSYQFNNLRDRIDQVYNEIPEVMQSSCKRNVKRKLLIVAVIIFLLLLSFGIIMIIISQTSKILIILDIFLGMKFLKFFNKRYVCF